MLLTRPVRYASQWKRGWINGVHRGEDWTFLRNDKPNTLGVYAAAPGVVTAVQFGYKNGRNENGGWGNRIVVTHTDRSKTTYNHLLEGSAAVSLGQPVDRGQTLATMGNTGLSSGDHLHFEMLLDGHRVNPAPYYSQDLPGTAIVIPTPGGGGGRPTPPPSDQKDDDMSMVITATRDSKDGLIKKGFSFTDDFTGPLVLLTGEELNALRYFRDREGIPFRNGEWSGDQIRDLMTRRGYRPWRANGSTDYVAAPRF